MGLTLYPRPPDEYAEIRRQLAAIGNNINQIARTVNARGFASGEDIAAITAAQENLQKIEKHQYAPLTAVVMSRMISDISGCCFIIFSTRLMELSTVE